MHFTILRSLVAAGALLVATCGAAAEVADTLARRSPGGLPPLATAQLPASQVGFSLPAGQTPMAGALRTADFSRGAGHPPARAGAPDRSVPSAVDEGKLAWRKANLTNYNAYPAPGTEECIAYNGCTWSGQFAALDQRQTEQWVREHNIIAVHEKDFATYKLHTLRLRSGKSRIDAVVYDLCADSDCGGCCTTNAAQHGLDFLIDIEGNAMRRFDGIGDGIVEWACIDC